MPTSIREQVLAAFLTILEGITGITGLEVLRNDARDVDTFPTLILQDADSSQRIDERAGGITAYSIDVVIEAFVTAGTPANIGAAVSALYAATWTAAASAVSDPNIFEVLEGDMDSQLIDEEGLPPHAMFALEVEIKFGAVPDNPFTTA